MKAWAFGALIGILAIMGFKFFEAAHCESSPVQGGSGQFSMLLPGKIDHSGVYSIDYRYEGQVVGSSLMLSASSGRQDSSSRLVGTLAWRRSSEACGTPAESCWSLTISPREFEYRISGRSLGSTLVDDLSRPISLSMAANGAISQIGFQAGVSAGAAAFLRELLSRTQFVTAARAGQAGRWTTDEIDGVGHYVAAYEVRDEAKDHLKVTKAVTQHDAAFVDWGSPGHPAVGVAGTGEVVIEGSGRIANLSESQKFSMSLGDSDRADWTVTVSLVRTGDVPSVGTLGTTPTIAMPDHFDDLSGAQARTGDERRLQAAELGEETTEAVFARVDELEQAASGARFNREEISAKKRDAVLKLYALLFLHPELCDEFAERWLAAAPDSITASFLAGALSQVGSAAAQAALRKMAESSFADDYRLTQAITATALFSGPDPKTVETMAHVARSSTELHAARDAAVLGLGAFAGRLSETNPTAAIHISSTLASGLREARTEGERQVFLAAMGNAGAAAERSEVQSAAHDPVAAIRGTAARALRSVPGPAAIDELLRLLTTDTEVDVRGEAAKALCGKVLSQGNVDGVIARMSAEESPRVRAEVLRTLWYARTENPHSAATVITAATEDKSAEVRGVAATLIAGDRYSSP